MGNRSLNQLVKILIVCGMVAGCFFSCIILREMGMEVDRLSMERCGSHVLTCFAVGLGLLFVAGAMVIAVTLLQMMRSLDQEPFVMKNVRALRRMGFVALGMAACCCSCCLPTRSWRSLWARRWECAACFRWCWRRCLSAPSPASRKTT